MRRGRPSSLTAEAERYGLHGVAVEGLRLALLPQLLDMQGDLRRKTAVLRAEYVSPAVYRAAAVLAGRVRYQALEVERRANAYIWADHPIRIWYPSAEELAALPYRSKKELTGAVRITEFPGADRCACCGTHVSSSGQVGLLKLLSCQKFRDGVRLELLCGQRALDCLAAGWEQARQIGQALSVKPQSAFAAVSRLQEELLSLKEKAARLEEADFAHVAAQYRGAGSVLHIAEPLDGDGARRLCDAIAKAAGGRCAVFAGQDGDYRYAVIESGGDLRQFIKDMNTALHGRGGGRDGFAQGSAACTAEEVRAFFQAR